MIPFLGTLNIRCRIIIGIQKGTIILTTTHMVCTEGRGGSHASTLGPKYRLYTVAQAFSAEGLWLIIQGFGISIFCFYGQHP